MLFARRSTTVQQFERVNSILTVLNHKFPQRLACFVQLIPNIFRVLSRLSLNFGCVIVVKYP